MKLVTLLLLLVSAALSASGATLEDKGGSCNKEVKCLQNDYKEYIKCLETKRVKRQTCNGQNSILTQTVPQQIIPCNFPNCNYIQNVQPCIGGATYCECIYSCSTSCSGYRCGDRCDRSCPKDPNPTTTIIPPPDNLISTERPIIEGKIISVNPNITTTINLINIVNNTNIVNAPTSLNNTNINYIDLRKNSTVNEQLNETTNERCCVVVQPRVCEKINSSTGGVRCIHRKHHTCGEECTSDTIHAQVRQLCNGPPSVCTPQVAYVPQPQPRCSYQPTWPYVSCGSRPKSCGGCYDHYGYGFQQYYGASQPSCSGCYDDGYQPGSLYRQGPFYQPGYYHMPPVNYVPLQPIQNSCGSIGCFGNDRMDPVFGAPSYSPYAESPFYYPPQYSPQPDEMQPPQYPPWPQFPQFPMIPPCFLPPYYQPQQCPASFFPPPPMYPPMPYPDTVYPSAPNGSIPQPPIGQPVTEKPAKRPSLGEAEQ